MKILVTGAAGFIGSALTLRLLERGDEVVGIDNHNDYYDPALKEARLSRQLDHDRYTHQHISLEDQNSMEALFKTRRFQQVVNLAAQAGVRYSLENPLAYLNSNLVGFGHVLEGCRHNRIEHLVYASSSSVYGSNTRMPFSVHHNVDHPVSLYVATKKANELMAHSYSHLYQLPTTGLRFFTVTAPGTGPIWPCKSLPEPWFLVNPSRSSTMANIVGTLPMSTISWRASSESWTAPPQPMQNGMPATPIQVPAWHLGGYTILATIARLN